MAGIGMVRRVGACAYLVVRVKGDGRAQHAQQQLAACAGAQSRWQAAEQGQQRGLGAPARRRAQRAPRRRGARRSLRRRFS